MASSGVSQSGPSDTCLPKISEILHFQGDDLSGLHRATLTQHGPTRAYAYTLPIDHFAKTTQHRFSSRPLVDDVLYQKRVYQNSDTEACNERKSYEFIHIVFLSLRWSALTG